MTETRTLTPRMAGGLTAVAVIGSGVVFLLATAGLLNALAAQRPLPHLLRQGAVTAHVASVLLALPLGISPLVLPKGTVRHRTVGYVWLALMVFTALVSFAVHTINPGGLSYIHLFSLLTLVTAPVIAWSGRTGRVSRHQRAVLGLMIGGLVIAGLFTFVPGRVMGELAMGLLGR